MCLTGVDYFSSMGFQPGISFLAAGILSPLATLNLVLLTLLGALPSYCLIARESPNGLGSFTIYEKILKGWTAKTVVLILLGFAATDFVFTITMCAADATAHLVENPFVPEYLHNRTGLTIGLISILGIIFLFGFHEAIRLSVFLVAAYLLVNVITIGKCFTVIIQEPQVFHRWLEALTNSYQSFWQAFGISALAFPQLALGLSGFETGVAVMTHIKTAADDETQALEERIRNTRKLLFTVAIIMSVFLLFGSLVTTLLIPPELFKEGQQANGRALAYLAHKYLGHGFGSLYDLSTIMILWFAGASGMAALLSLVPQYLPRYGMAPGWAEASRPLVLFITLVCFAITIFFKAEVDAQAGAFATGLLVLISSGSIAVTLAEWKRGFLHRLIFCTISLAFAYSSVVIICTRPDGLLISIFFIVSMMTSSLISRALRSTELRIESVVLDEAAKALIAEAAQKGEIRLLAHRPGHSLLLDKETEMRTLHTFEKDEGSFIFLEVTTTEVSDFKTKTLQVSGYTEGPHMILRCKCLGIPNAIAALLLHIRDQTGKVPHAYFGWTEGNPLAYVLKFVFFGDGETAPLTREILRSAEHDPKRRPRIHVA